MDIYHPTQDELTGAEIAFGGDSTRSLKEDNYFVLETEAQGYPGWTPYDGTASSAGIQSSGFRGKYGVITGTGIQSIILLRLTGRVC